MDDDRIAQLETEVAELRQELRAAAQIIGFIVGTVAKAGPQTSISTSLSEDTNPNHATGLFSQGFESAG